MTFHPVDRCRIRPRRRLTGLLLAAAVAAATALGGCSCSGSGGWDRIYNPVCQL